VIDHDKPIGLLTAENLGEFLMIREAVQQAELGQRPLS
jgi:hypothetical protein